MAGKLRDAAGNGMSARRLARDVRIGNTTLQQKMDERESALLSAQIDALEQAGRVQDGAVTLLDRRVTAWLA